MLFPHLSYDKNNQRQVLSLLKVDLEASKYYTALRTVPGHFVMTCVASGNPFTSPTSQDSRLNCVTGLQIIVAINGQ